MKKLGMLLNIMGECSRLEEMASEVRNLGGYTSEKFVFCFHTHYSTPCWSVWPIGYSPTGAKSLELELVGSGFNVSNARGLTDEDINDIKEDIMRWIDT